jgi:hypothetical protein
MRDIDLSVTMGIRLVDAEGTLLALWREHVSLYGLRLVFPVHIPVDTQVTGLLSGGELFGPAKMRHSEPFHHLRGPENEFECS